MSQDFCSKGDEVTIDTIIRPYEAKELKLTTSLLPVLTRYFDFLGIVDSQDGDKVSVQVYGYREVALGEELMAMRRKEAPVDLSLDHSDRKFQLSLLSQHYPEPTDSESGCDCCCDDH